MAAVQTLGELCGFTVIEHFLAFRADYSPILIVFDLIDSVDALSAEVVLKLVKSLF
jgi:hypothetical protein